jgi:hypothetical protein
LDAYLMAKEARLHLTVASKTKLRTLKKPT